MTLENEKSIEEKVAGHLEEAFKDDDTPIVEDDPNPEPEDKDDATPEPEKDPEKDEDVSLEKELNDTDDDAKPEADGDPEPSTLPDAYLRAAIHQGWTPEKVKKFYDADPENAESTLKNIYESTNKISAQFAELGKNKLAADHIPDSQPQPVQTPRPTPAPAESFSGDDMKKLEEEYGDDPILEVIRRQDAALIQQRKYNEHLLQQSKADTKSRTEKLDKEESDLVGKQVDTFFEDDGLKQYNSLYGASVGRDWMQLTGEQLGNRNAVTTLADQMIVGATLQGQELSNEDALEKAHLVVSQPHSEKMILDRLTNNLKKRSNGITLAPNSSADRPSNSGGELSPAELVVETEKRLAKTFK